MYLQIINEGEVPVEAFTLVGASTKREDDGKIGMFGSGNKYALSYLLRNKYDVKIYSGLNDLNVHAEQVNFGGRKIGVIQIGGQKTSITTEMGPEWTLWQSIREFYSNAMDEGLVSFEIVEEPTFRMGFTSIFVEAKPEIIEFMENKDLYFCDQSQFLFRGKNGSILAKNQSVTNIFRKGIKCYDENNTSIFDYNFENIEVNEDRLVKSTSRINSYVWDLILECDNVVVIREFLEGISNRGFMESNEMLHYWTPPSGTRTQFSPAWKEALKGRYICPIDLGGWIESEDIKNKTYFIPTKLHSELRIHFGESISALKANFNGNMIIRKKEADALQVNTIKKALDFYEEVGYPITDDIQVVEFIQESGLAPIMGMAKEGEILISTNAFNKGVFYVATVIYEEHIHLKHKCKDETRHMQDCLIEEILTYMKKKNGINL